MYEFTEDCMIHIDNIDEEHRKLFQMLNEAFALVKETDNAASIAKNLIANLKDCGCIAQYPRNARLCTDCGGKLPWNEEADLICSISSE